MKPAVNDAERRRIAREYVAALRAVTKCAHCDAPMRDWHNPEHLAEPIRRVGRMVGIGRSIEKIQSEIDRCTPLCRRCHMAEDRPESRPPPSPGEANSHAKVTWADVRAIRARRATSSLAALAREYGLGIAEIGAILRNATWRDPTYERLQRKPRIDGRVRHPERKYPSKYIPKGNFKKKITHCPMGHPYDDVNTYTWHGRRYCRTCHRQREQLRKQGGHN